MSQNSKAGSWTERVREKPVCEIWCGRRACEDRGCDGKFPDGVPTTTERRDAEGRDFAKLAEIPAVESEEIAAALFESDNPGNDHLSWSEWLAYVDKHGTSTTLWKEINACRRRAEVVLTLMAAAREQGRKDVAAASFQSRVRPWLIACFGELIAGDREERNHRFLEEALELVQARGCTAAEAHQLVDYVYGRPVGIDYQEVGGVMTTLAALCLANHIDMHEAAEVELTRIWTKVDEIRAKQAAKPKRSPLPEHFASDVLATGGAP